MFGLPIYGGGPWSEDGALLEHKALAPGAKAGSNAHTGPEDVAEAGVVDHGAVDALASALAQADLEDAHSTASSSLQSAGVLPPADTAFSAGPERWASTSAGGAWSGSHAAAAAAAAHHHPGEKRFFSLPEMGGAVDPPSRRHGSAHTASPWAPGASSTDPQPPDSPGRALAQGGSRSFQEARRVWRDSPEGEVARDPPAGVEPAREQTAPPAPPQGEAPPSYGSAAEALAAAQAAAARNDQATLMQALKALESLSGMGGAAAHGAASGGGFMPGPAPRGYAAGAAAAPASAPVAPPAPYGPMQGMGAPPPGFPGMPMPGMPMAATAASRGGPSSSAAGPRLTAPNGMWPAGLGGGVPMHMAAGVHGWMPYPVLDLPLALTLESSRYVCLTGVPTQRTEEDVRRLLEAFGPLRWVWDRWSRCGFYFAAFYDLRHAEVAARTLAVRGSTPPPPPPLPIVPGLVAA